MRILFLLLIALSLNASDELALHNKELFGALTLLPPFLAIVLAFLTKEVIMSLFIGVFSGTLLLSISSNLIAKDFSLYALFDTIILAFSSLVKHLLNSITDAGNAGVILQVLCIGGVVALITKMGGVSAIANSLTRFIKGPVAAQVNTWLVGLCIFFDDYANSLTVGPIMRPITDKFKVSREKLSFILDSTAAPVAGIAIVSTWIGVEVGLINTAYGLINIKDINAFGIFLETIPYRLFNIFMLSFVVLTAISKREFGPMYIAESNCKKGILSKAALDVGAELEKELKPNENISHKISDALIPILTLIIGALFCFYFSGLSALDEESLAKVKENYFSFYALRTTFGEADSSIALFQAALFASVIAVIMGLIRKKFNHKEAIETWLHGWKSMIFTIAMLLFAWSLTSIVKELGTPDYIVSLLGEKTPKILLPSVIFLFGSIMSFAIGTSYGTMGILMPLAIPLAYAVAHQAGFTQNEIHHYMVISISCVLSGAIFGNLCSPIADTMILSAMSAKCELSAHVKTQMPYAIFVCVITVVFGYLPVSAGIPVWLVIIFGIFAMYILLRFIGKKVE